MKFEKKEWLYLKIVCLAAFAVMLPIAVFGIPDGNDLPQHFQFAHAYYDALVSGDFFPGWSARENYGYGSIGIRFYPPLAYYVLAVARIVAGNWFIAAYLTFTFWMTLGCLGVYFWARSWMGAKEAAIAGIFYAVFPSHLNQIYISFIYADFAGAAILPFCFAFLTRALERDRKSDFLGLAVSYALLVLTHLPTTIIGSLCLAIYALFFLRRENWLRRAFKAALALSLGLAASSFYWVAMVSEMGWLNHATEKYQSGHYYFGNRFFPLYLHRIASDFKDGLLVSDIITACCLLFLAAPVVYLFYRRQKDFVPERAAQIFRTVLPLGAFAFFLITPLSYPIWKIITPLQKIQFPMRLMSIVGMCGAIATAAAVYFLLKGDFLKKRGWVYASVLFAAIFLLIDFTYMLYPSAFTPIERAKFEKKLAELPEQENYVFWWSVWSDRKALEIREKVLAENRPATIDGWEPENRSFTISAGAPAKARVATFYYPRWRARVNGQPIEIERDAHGAMLIPLGAEKAVVELYFEEPPPVKIASLVSLAAWLFLIASLLRFGFRKNSFSESQSQFAEEEFIF